MSRYLPSRMVVAQEGFSPPNWKQLWVELRRKVVSGIQEILVVAVVILILFYLPKRTADSRIEKSIVAHWTLSGKMRLAILASVIWLAIGAYLLQPWQERIYPFIYFGLGPVALAWGVGWVISGYRKHK